MQTSDTSDTDVIFHKIITREIPAYIVYEDADTLAFLDSKPNHPGHTLVIPKKHFRNLLDMDEETLTKLMKIVQKVAIAVKEAVHADGVNINTNNEPAAGQVIMHAHVHIIPRFEGDGFTFFPHEDLDPLEGEKVAEEIRAQLS
jgi:histidine triad (HIT) family protein